MVYVFRCQGCCSVFSGKCWSDIRDVHTYTSNGNRTITLVAGNNCGTDTATIDIEVTGLPQTSVAYTRRAAAAVYPNPAQQLIHVASTEETQRIVIYDSRGQVVYYTTSHGTGHDISTTGWTPGLYIVNIHTRQGCVTDKVQLLK